MNPYHKIQTVYLRDPETKHRTLLDGEFALPEFGLLKDVQWIFTEKVDGTNIRVFHNGEAVEFRGRTDNAQMPPRLLAGLNEAFGQAQCEWLQDNSTLTLYGEGYGASIQKGGGNYRPKPGFVLFDVLHSGEDGGVWLERDSVEEIARTLNLDAVPIIGCGTLRDMVERVRQGVTSQWGSFRAEGIVARPIVELRNRRGERIITKVKCKDFQ